MRRCDWCGRVFNDDEIFIKEHKHDPIDEGEAIGKDSIFEGVYFCSEKCRAEWVEKNPNEILKYKEHKKALQEYYKTDEYKQECARRDAKLKKDEAKREAKKKREEAEREAQRQSEQAAKRLAFRLKVSAILAHLVSFFVTPVLMAVTIIATFPSDAAISSFFALFCVVIFLIVFIISSCREGDSDLLYGKFSARGITLWRHFIIFHIIGWCMILALKLLFG